MAALTVYGRILTNNPQVLNRLHVARRGRGSIVCVGQINEKETIIYVLLNKNGLYLAYSGKLVKETVNAMQFESWQDAEAWRKGLWLKQNFVARKVN